MFRHAVGDCAKHPSTLVVPSNLVVEVLEHFKPILEVCWIFPMGFDLLFSSGVGIS